MNCPVCGGTVTPNSTNCDWCTVKLVADAVGRVTPAFPPVNPGEVLVGVDLRSSPLPGENARAREWKSGSRYLGSGDGITLSIAVDMHYYFAQPFLSMRDGCVRASMIALDPHLALKVFVRQTWIETAMVRYEMIVHPSERTFAIQRFCGGGPDEVAGETPVLVYSPSEAIAPQGYPNIVELRCQGPTLQAWINGYHVGSAHDAALGSGQFGMCLGTSKKPDPNVPRRALAQWFEIREVQA